jgi:hypothetical protein
MLVSSHYPTKAKAKSKAKDAEETTDPRTIRSGPLARMSYFEPSKITRKLLSASGSQFSTLSAK